MVGLAAARRLFPAQLSQGMRQRVNLARMLVTEPLLLLMDEPFGALDAQTRTTMQDEFLQIWERQHKSVVFVTHDLQEAVLLADRVVVMVGGRIMQEVTVPFERPRIPDDLRFDAAYQQLVRRLWRLIGPHGELGHEEPGDIPEVRATADAATPTHPPC
jgi:NitT/TauT family transport system ATP-binding protein